MRSNNKRNSLSKAYKIFMSEFWPLLCSCIGKYNFKHTLCWIKYWLPFIFWLQCSSFKIFLRPNCLLKKSVKTQIFSPILSGDILTGLMHSKSMKILASKIWIFLLRSSTHLQKFLAEVRLMLELVGIEQFMLQVFIFLAQPPAKEDKQQQGGFEMFLKRQKTYSM